MTKIDSPSRLRELASKRKQQGETTQALTIPLVLDQDASDAAVAAKTRRERMESAAVLAEERYEREVAKLELRIGDLADALAERDEAESGDAADVRGNGVDTTGLGQRAAAAEAELDALEKARVAAREREAEELERQRAAEKDAIAKAREGIAYLIFGRITSAAYEALMVEHGGADLTDPSKERVFLDALLAKGFLRIEYPDGEKESMPWASILELLQPSQGELGTWRLMCFAHQARAGVDVPFASRPSATTQSS